MEYTKRVIVPGDLDAVAALFTDTTTWSAWQPTLQTVEVLEGTPPATGARTRLTFRRGRRGTMVMTETVELGDLPRRWRVVYEADGVRNVCDTRFEQGDARTTLVEQRNEFGFSGVMRVVGALFGSSFPKETQRSLDAFRDFAARRTQAPPA